MGRVVSDHGSALKKGGFGGTCCSVHFRSIKAEHRDRTALRSLFFVTSRRTARLFRTLRSGRSPSVPCESQSNHGAQNRIHDPPLGRGIRSFATTLRTLGRRNGVVTNQTHRPSSLFSLASGRSNVSLFIFTIGAVLSFKDGISTDVANERTVVHIIDPRKGGRQVVGRAQTSIIHRDDLFRFFSIG